MRLYRLVKEKYAATAWSGYGAQMFGGRWNHKGQAVVYLSTSISLAVLESLVHLKEERALQDFCLFSLDVDDDALQILDRAVLPDSWREGVAPVATMDMGTQWLKSCSSLGLLVPSAVIPPEYNVLYNPAHPLSESCLRSVKPVEMDFDPRLKPVL